MTSLHIDNCKCQFSHKDYITAEGRRNLSTYKIDYRCYGNGVTAGTGTMWKVEYELDYTAKELSA